MNKTKELIPLVKQHGFNDFKWINPQNIVVSTWVRFKCMFGCGSFGQKGSCPPNTPSIKECKNFFSEYHRGLVFHFEQQFEDPASRFTWTNEMNKKLLCLERDVFLSGYQKTFLLFLDECCLCRECSGTRTGCKDKKNSRPGPEALGVDVFSTVRKLGYPIEVLNDFHQAMNRYAFLLIE